VKNDMAVQNGLSLANLFIAAMKLAQPQAYAKKERSGKMHYASRHR
jgi:uncharacterized membrane protein YcjF (UPF0283 family)